MLADEGLVLAKLRDDYGRDWFIGRTYDADGVPHWWRATRRRRLSDRELERGLAATLIYDTAPLLGEALLAQAELEQRLSGWTHAHR
ncbi:MAG: hypothetical protein ACRDOO_29045 [Actinomadura sp.]